MRRYVALHRTLSLLMAMGMDAFRAIPSARCFAEGGRNSSEVGRSVVGELTTELIRTHNARVVNRDPILHVSASGGVGRAGCWFVQRKCRECAARSFPAPCSSSLAEGVRNRMVPTDVSCSAGAKMAAGLRDVMQVLIRVRKAAL
jgi:hypothetical protein